MTEYKFNLDNFQKILNEIESNKTKNLLPPPKLRTCRVCGKGISSKGICFCNDIYSDK